MPATSNVTISWMIRRDLPRVLAIENESFVVPWSEDDFLCTLRTRNSIGLVCAEHGEVVGYVLYELEGQKIHVLNLAVAPDHRRCGHGAAMVQRLKEKLRPDRRTAITMLLSERDLAAQLFLASQDFECIEIKHGCYEVSDDDGYVMEFRLND